MALIKTEPNEQAYTDLLINIGEARRLAAILNLDGGMQDIIKRLDVYLKLRASSASAQRSIRMSRAVLNIYD